MAKKEIPAFEDANPTVSIVLPNDLLKSPLRQMPHYLVKNRATMGHGLNLLCSLLRKSL